MKWLIFLPVFFLVRLAFKKGLAEMGGRWFDPHVIAVTGVGNAVTFSALLWLASGLWDPGENWLGRMAWHFRNLARIEQWYAGGVIVTVVAFAAVAAALAARPGVYFQAVATSLEKLVVFVAGVIAVVVYVQFIALTASAVRSVWSGEIAWAPAIYPWLLKLLTFSWGIAVLIGAVVAIGLTLAAAYEALRPFVLFAGLVWPYARGHALVYENFDLSLEWRHHDCKPGMARKLLLVSDLHLTSEDAPPIHSKRKTSESQLFVANVIESTQPDLIVVAGDVTDVGEPKAWEAASKLFSEHRDKVFCVLGNHDIHFYRSFAPGFLAPMSVDDRPLRKHLQSIEGRPFEGFPRVERFPDLSLVLVGLDSNRRPPGTPITNAIGEVGQQQLTVARERVQQALRPGDLVIVVVHHQIVSPKISWDAIWLRCMDADAVLAFATEMGAGAIVHGHKHMPYIARAPDGTSPLIVSCGSTHHLPDGPFALEAAQPSAYQLSIVGNSIESITLIRDATVVGARPAGMAGQRFPG